MCGKGIDMLDNKGFDLWADGYDRTVYLSDEDGSYPFAGYRDVLGYIYDRIRSGHVSSILDIGIGTGVLAGRLYLDGYPVTGVDFSENMIRIAGERLPGARIFRHDFSKGRPRALEDEKFDAIVCTYALHHLDEDQQVTLISAMKKHLAPKGRIFIGDISFKSHGDMQACKTSVGDDWDDEEHYFIAEEMLKAFPGAEYKKISHCAGVLTISKE